MYDGCWGTPLPYGGADGPWRPYAPCPGAPCPRRTCRMTRALSGCALALPRPYRSAGLSPDHPSGQSFMGPSVQVPAVPYTRVVGKSGQRCCEADTNSRIVIRHRVGAMTDQVTTTAEPGTPEIPGKPTSAS